MKLLGKEDGIRLLAKAPSFHPTGEQNFIKSLINFDKDNISDKVLKKIGAYCAQPDFQPDIIGRVSLAAKSLCMWVRAMEVRVTGLGLGVRRTCLGGGQMHRLRRKEGMPGGEGAGGLVGDPHSLVVSLQLYGRLYRVVEPKRIRMNAALAQLREKQAALAEAQEKLREVPLPEL
ncbi:Dynein heavy chain 2, axonemal [Saguinus oedipus]|uniref:Dynein heavy chain 2, axonemal n=1 Tax=Saguinus oedipus TaxID=9490 RepID=A0ABQ9VPA9_SAGOE|nr:Dynein heavy chain 2, axonemal [Saguinus oedipus]